MQKYVKIGKAGNVIKEKFGLDINSATLRKWYDELKYPEMFIKFGSRIYIDTEIIPDLIKKEQKERVTKAIKMQNALKIIENSRNRNNPTIQRG